MTDKNPARIQSREHAKEVIDTLLQACGWPQWSYEIDVIAPDDDGAPK